MKLMNWTRISSRCCAQGPVMLLQLHDMFRYSFAKAARSPSGVGSKVGSGIQPLFISSPKAFMVPGGCKRAPGT